MKRIGIIGLGIMGHGMAVNFLKSGYEIAVWNRTKTKADDLIKDGATFLSSPKQLTEFSDIVFDVVSDDEASREVWFGEEGILAGGTKEKVLITCATLSLDCVDELIEATQTKNYPFLDMPLTGSRAGAESGSLILLVGGEAKVLDSIRSELAAISRSVHYFGPAGSGMKFKLILNLLLGVTAVASSQAALLAIKSGLDSQTVKSALADGMAPYSPQIGFLFDSLKQPQEQTRFSIKWLEKDLRYAQKMADGLGLDLNLLNDAQKDFAKANAQGLGDDDWTKIFEVYRTKGNL